MKILVPLDGSTCSETAITWARFIALKTGASITLLRSYLPFQDVHLAPQLPITVAELVNDEGQEKEINEYLTGKAGEFGELEVTTRCAQGSAAQCILESAGEADLIVMATHGRGFISHAVMGSTTERVLRRAPCPVLVVPERR